MYLLVVAVVAIRHLWKGRPRNGTTIRLVIFQGRGVRIIPHGLGELRRICVVEIAAITAAAAGAAAEDVAFVCMNVKERRMVFQ